MLKSQGEATRFPERIGTTILAREARRKIYKDRVAERKRAMRRARIERGAGDVLEEPGDKYDEQVAVRHADASGDCIIEDPTRREKKERHASQRKRIRSNK